MNQQHPQKQWWAPVWKDLVMDSQAKHCRTMKNALWLYLYFLLNANRRTGLLMRKIQTISGDMGVTRDTTVRWLNVLRTNGYVTTVNTGRSLTIQVTRWKPLPGVAKSPSQKSGFSDTRDGKLPTPSHPTIRPDPLRNSQKSEATVAANDTKIQIIIQNDTPRGTADRRSGGAFSKFSVRSPAELLAQELAQTLHDSAGINLYRSYCAKYPERLLRNVLAEVQAVPAAKITKGRAALFNYLVQFHAQRTPENSGR